MNIDDQKDINEHVLLSLFISETREGSVRPRIYLPLIKKKKEQNVQ